MKPLEIKKMRLDLVKIAAAKAELEYKIEERKEDIQRMKDHIKLQEERESKIQTQLEEVEQRGDK